MQPGINNLHAVTIVDTSESHRRELHEALFSFYEVQDYEDAVVALKAFITSPPHIIIVGDNVGKHNSLHLIRHIRNQKLLHHVPILFITEGKNPTLIHQAKTAGVDEYLIKPYLRSNLLNTISRIVNRDVEKSWENLSLVQKDSLKNTLTVFNNIADFIANGESIAFKKVSDACTPLIEAIKQNDFRDILTGVKNHDNYTYSHSMRVATLLSLLGQAAGLKEEEHKILASGGLLHDVGKMMIPHQVLNKAGKLDEAEFEIMKSHVIHTVNYLESAGDVPKQVIDIAGKHHEKLDGTGYPNGLKGKEINELVRMASIVDVFSALTDRRVYKAPMSPEVALKIMQEEMSHHLDQHLLKLFRGMLLDAAIEKESEFGEVLAVRGDEGNGCC